jgi:hypothetical protein
VPFSEFALRIVLLFLPGVISFLIVDKLTAHRPFKPHSIAIYSLLLGFYCYVVYAIVMEVTLSRDVAAKMSFVEALTDPRAKLDLFEIIMVSSVAIPIGLAAAFVINHTWLHRSAQFLRVSRKFGDIDVWSYIMNSNIEPWVVVRDREHDVMYDGWIAAFSDTTEKSELFLRDVKVFRNSTGDLLYETPARYLPRRRDSITVEFGAVGYTEAREGSGYGDGKGKGDSAHSGGMDQEGGRESSTGRE